MPGSVRGPINRARHNVQTLGNDMYGFGAIFMPGTHTKHDVETKVNILWNDRFPLFGAIFS